MKIKTTVRCFRRLKDKPHTTRCGIWLMTGPRRGAFFHGDREEVQTPQYSIKQLETNKGLFQIQEISPEEAINELESWPRAQEEAIVIFKRHSRQGKEQ